MALNKPPVLPTWGETMQPADTQQPPNAEIQAGWPHSDIAPSRQYFNWFFNWVMGGIRYLCSRGLPDWDGEETYQVGATVIGDNGKVYRSKIADNINHKPSESSGQWKLAFYETDEADDRFAPRVGTANAIGALQQKDAAHDASIKSLTDNKFDKTGGNLTGPTLMPSGGTNGYMFDVDTGMSSAGDGDVRLKANGVVRVVVTPTGVQFLNTDGDLIATADNNGVKINSINGAANLYMGPTGYLVCKDDGTQGGLYMGASLGWSSLFAKTPVAGANSADVVTAEWIRRFISVPAGGVIDIGDVRLMRGAFVAGDIATWPQESSGSITFPASFGAEPTVVLGAYGDARLAFMSISGSPRANGFDWRGQENTGTSLQQNYICSYFAMGPKP